MKTNVKSLVEQTFNELSVLEGHQYKSRAYHNAYEVIANMSEEEFSSRNTFIDIYGIGRGINDKIYEIRTTSCCKRLEELRKESSDLLDNRLYKVRKGFITKRIPLVEASEYVDEIKTLIGSENSNITIAGSVRRRKSLIADIDLIFYGNDDLFNEKLDILGEHYETLSRGEYKASYLIDKSRNIQLDIIHTSEEEFPFQLLYLTGSKEFNIRMRGIAKSKGYTLNQKGLFNIITGERVDGLKTEESIFAYLGMNYTLPQNR